MMQRGLLEFAMVSQTDILRRLREQPFEPFFVRLTNGTTHAIRHPEQAIVTSRSIVLGIPRSEDGPRDEFRDYALVSLLHVVQIDPIGTLPGGAPPTSEAAVGG
jgi:hypothetical protein